jgi:hypothetical protein
MADQIDVIQRLNAHHTDQGAVHVVAEERDPGCDLVIEFGRRHVRLAPAIVGYHGAIGLGGGVDDLQNSLALLGNAAPNPRVAHVVNLAIQGARVRGRQQN